MKLLELQLVLNEQDDQLVQIINRYNAMNEVMGHLIDLPCEIVGDLLDIKQEISETILDILKANYSNDMHYEVSDFHYKKAGETP